MRPYFRLGLFPLPGRRATKFDRFEIELSRRIGNPCWGYQKIKLEISLSFPIFGFWPDYKLLNWVRAAYGLPPLEEDLPF